MRFRGLCLVALILLWQNSVFAGGAVARRMRGGGGPMQQQQMQQMLQAQAQAQQKELAQRQSKLGPEHEISFDELSQQLAVSSRIWIQLMDKDVKLQIVKTYIDWYRQQGIILRKSPQEYVFFLDEMALQDASILDRPFKDVLKIAAIMEYDFDNGMNKDQLARKVLGPQLYQLNRKRLGG